MKSIAFTGIVLALLLLQPRNPSARELLDAARPLTNTEIATVLTASQNALAGKTFQLSFVGSSGGTEVLMGRAGRPKRVRLRYAGGIIGGVVFPDGTSSRTVETHQKTVELIDYTGRSARRCDGSSGQGELVIEYRQTGQTGWTATAREQDARDFGAPAARLIFELLQGRAPVTSGDRRQIDGRSARAFTASWTPPKVTSDPEFLSGDPLPNIVGDPVPTISVQSLWIGTKSLLPLRWEASDRGVLVYAYDFTYRKIDLRQPAGVSAPDCIS